MEHFDLLVIGGGPGGIAACMRGAALGLRTALVESSQTGGVCLNAGCMPTKFLLARARPDLDQQVLFAEKERVITRLRAGADAMLAKAGVTVLRGTARFEDAYTVRYDHAAAMAERIVIAVGSAPRMLAALPAEKTLSPEAFLREPATAASYAVVGGGPVGVEFAFLLASMGKRVALFEKQARILPACDAEFVRRIERQLRKLGVTVTCGTDVTPDMCAPFERVLCCAGRVPNTEGLDLAAAGVSVRDGWIVTDDAMRTSAGHVFACGDVRGAYQYAYTAEREGAIAAETAAGAVASVMPAAVPYCVFSKPGYASVGMTEEAAAACGMTYRTVKKDLISLSSAHLYDDTDGAVKMIVDVAGRIAGVQVLSNAAHELITAATLAVAQRMRVEDLAAMLCVHPSVSESFVKAAEASCA